MDTSMAKNKCMEDEASISLMSMALQFTQSPFLTNVVKRENTVIRPE